MQELTDVLRRLRNHAAAQAVLVVDDDGDLVAGDAEAESPSAMLRQLWVNQLGGAEGFSRLVESPTFAILVHEASGEDVLVSHLAEERILCIVYDENRTSLGVVRLRLKEHHGELMQALQNGDGDEQ